MFDNKCICDYWQARCLFIGTTQEQVDDNFLVDGNPIECPGQAPCQFALHYHAKGIIHKGYVNEPDERWVIEGPKIKLVDICVRSGLVPSKNEFRRKCEQKGLKYNDKPVTDFNMEIDATVPDIWHEVRLGKRFLEIVVPILWRDEDHEND